MMKWTAAAKLDFLQKYRAGAFTQTDLSNADMTLEELAEWSRAYDRHGLNGLKTTRLQEHRGLAPPRHRRPVLTLIHGLAVLIAASAAPANAWDCGDLPCADTRPPHEAYQPHHEGGGSAATACVRQMARSGKQLGIPVEKIISAASGCGGGIDRALARIIVQDELR